MAPSPVSLDSPLARLLLLILSIAVASTSPAGAALIGSPIQLTGGNSWWPAVCYNAHSDQYLVGWAQYGGAYGVQTMLRRIDASTGDILGEDIVPYLAPRSWKPGLACSSLDHRWLVVYSVEMNLQTGENDICGRTISSDGSQISDQIDILRTPGYQNDPILAYNQSNDNYLTVWSDGARIRGNLIAGDITPGDPSKIGPLIQISDSTPYTKNEYRVAYNPVVNEFMVVWTDYRNYPPESGENDNDWGDIYGQRINGATGALIGGNIPIYWGGSPYVRNGMDIPQIACNTTDGRYFIGVTKLSAAGWTTKGLVINHDGSWYSGLFDVSHPQRGSCVGLVHDTTDNSYLMTYLDAEYGITARRFSAAGQPVGSAMKVFSTAYEANFGALAVRPSDGQFMQSTVYFEHLTNHERPSILVAQRFSTGPDTDPPDKAEPARAYRRSASSVLLTWSNPTDQDYMGTKVVYRAGAFPTSPTDGTLLCDRPAVVNSNDSVTHSTTSNYYYSVFTYDASGNHSAPAQAFPSYVWANETFDSYGSTVLEAYGGWSKAYQKNSVQVQSAVHAGPEGKSVKMLAEDQYDDATLSGFGTITGGYHKVSFDMCRTSAPTPGGQENQAILEVYSGGYRIVRVYWGLGYKMLAGPGSTLTDLVPAPEPGRWYHVGIGMDIPSQTLDVWVDGLQVVSGDPFFQTATTIDRIALVGYTAATSASYLDNLKGEFVPTTGPPAAPVVVSPAMGASVQTPCPVVTWSGDSHRRLEVHVNTSGDPSDGSAFDSGEVTSRDNAWSTGPLEPNRSYYVFVRLYNSAGWGPWSPAGHWFHVIDDVEPPSAPTEFAAMGSSGFVRLSWRNPSDPDLTTAVVRRSTERYPVSQSDGSLVASIPATPGAYGSCTHTGASQGVRFYYSVFAVDDARLCSAPAIDSTVPEAWAVEYDGSALPSASSPPWTVLDDGGSESYAHVESAAGVLHVLDDSTSGGTKIRWYRDWAVPAGSGATVMVRAKCDSAAPADCSGNITLSNGTGFVNFVIFPDRVAAKLSDCTGTLDSQHALDGTAYHRYRFTLQGTTYVCYVDENPSAVFAGTASAASDNRILFGANGSAAAQSIYYDYLCYRTDAAQPPLGSSPTALTLDIPSAKLQPDGTWVRVQGVVVSLSLGDFLYVQSPDGPCGLRVTSASHGVLPGQVMDVTGVMATSASLERHLVAASTTAMGSATPRVVGVRLSQLGGSDLSYVPATGAGQAGVSQGIGPNSVGVLARVWGRVTAVDPSGSYFWIDDGSGVVKMQSGSLQEPPVDTYVIVTGAVALDVAGGTVRPRVLVGSQDGIRVF